MASIKLNKGFSLMGEGRQVLKITSTEYKEEFGQLKITMTNSKGQKHFENYRFINNAGETVDGAISAFSGLARAAMDSSDIEEIDPIDLVGKYVSCVIAHREYEAKDGTSKKTTEKAEGTWYEAVSDDEKFDGTEDKPKANGINLDDILA